MSGEVENVAEILGIMAVAIEDYPWSLAELAREAGCAAGTVSRILYGKTKSPHLRTVVGILLALGFRVEIKKPLARRKRGELRILARAA